MGVLVSIFSTFISIIIIPLVLFFIIEPKGTGRFFGKYFKKYFGGAIDGFKEGLNSDESEAPDSEDKE